MCWEYYWKERKGKLCISSEHTDCIYYLKAEMIKALEPDHLQLTVGFAVFKFKLGINSSFLFFLSVLELVCMVLGAETQIGISPFCLWERESTNRCGIFWKTWKRVDEKSKQKQILLQQLISQNECVYIYIN